MIADFFKTLWRTTSRHPVKLVCAAFVAFSVLWTLTEAGFHFSEWAELKGKKWIIGVGVVSCVYAYVARWKIAKVTIPLKQSNVSVEIVFGDIFQCDGITAIPVGEFFESELGRPVSPNSLHGIFIAKCFGGHPQAFDDQVTQQLASVRPTQIKKDCGKTARYPIGTTALLDAAGKKYLTFAFTHADPKTCKAYADVPLMFEALSGLWKFARTHMNGNALNVPLVGSGPSGVGLPTVDLLHILMLSFADESRREVITQRLRIALTWDRLDEVDLRKLKKDWEEK
jgi:hypothetical protein